MNPLFVINAEGLHSKISSLVRSRTSVFVVRVSNVEKRHSSLYANTSHQQHSSLYANTSQHTGTMCVLGGITANNG